MQFPKVSGRNLLRQNINLPQGFSGDLNLVFVPFYQVHQFDVNTWIPFASQMEQEYQGLAYYELPTIQRMGGLRQMFINEGMRAGIPDAKARLRTITLYLDKSEFRRSLEIPSEADIQVFLVSRDGRIYWREVGSFSPQKGAGLQQVLDSFVGAQETGSVKSKEPLKNIRRGPASRAG